MPELMVRTCLRCGADLPVEPHATRVQCRYCGTVAEVARPAPPPAAPPRPPYGSRGTVPGAWKSTIAIWGVLALGATLVSGFIAWQHAGAVSSGAGPVPRADGRGEGIPIAAGDLRAVDPADLIHQAAAEVRKRDQNCELIYAYIGEVKGGVLDATGHTSLLQWGCLTVDPTKPPGQDVLDHQWDVRVANGELALSRSNHASRHKPPWVEPGCRFADAWAAALASGLPANATTSVYYRGIEDAMVWFISVDGHPELERRIDGNGCTLVRKPS
jgi:hypothetical protein